LPAPKNLSPEKYSIPILLTICLDSQARRFSNRSPFPKAPVPSLIHQLLNP
jgi:hypothetical protein